MKDKNYGAVYGLGTDKDYIDAGLAHPSLEGKPGINDAIKEAVLEQMVTQVMKKNPTMSEDKARKKAKKIQERNMQR